MTDGNKVRTKRLKIFPVPIPRAYTIQMVDLGLGRGPLERPWDTVRFVSLAPPDRECFEALECLIPIELEEAASLWFGDKSLEQREWEYQAVAGRVYLLLCSSDTDLTLSTATVVAA